jgi:hypothetical protein
MLLEPLIVQLGGSSSYFGTGLHWPIVPGATHVMQAPQELVQHTPSAQKPLWQSLPWAHGSPKQPLHEPPQSTAVSLPSLIPFSHEKHVF